MRRASLLLLLLLLLSLSNGCGTLNERYIEADRATFNAVAHRLRAYYDADPNLTDLQKKNRKNTLDSWEARLDEAEAFLGITPNPDDGSIWWGWGRSRGRR